MIDDFDMKDLDVIQSMVYRGLTEAEPDCSVNEGELYRQLISLYDNPSAKLIVSKLDGKPIGFLLCFINNGFLLNDLKAQVVGAYILPEYRNQSYGKEMFKAALDWAEKRSVTKVVIASVKKFGEISQETIDEFGFKESGSIYERVM